MVKKIVSMFLILVLATAILQSYTYAAPAPAAGGTSGTFGSSDGGFDWDAKKKEMMTGDGDEDVLNPINDIAGTAITVTQIIAMGVAIIMLIVLAMKYMLSAPGDKASIQKHAVVYIVGAIAMFACTGILEIIRKFAGVLGE